MDMCWEGREKSDSFHSKESADRCSGITDMKEGGENSTMFFRSVSCHVARDAQFHCIPEDDSRTDDA